MRRFRDKRKVISLTIVGIAYALIVLPLIVSNVQKQQDLRSKAQVAQTNLPSELGNNIVNQNALAECTSSGNAEIGVSYTNSDATRSVNVTANDSVSGLSVNLGTIAPQQTNTAVIPTGKSLAVGGTITYTVAYVDTPTQTSQKTASYTTKTCTPASTSTQSKLAQVAAAAAATCGNVTTDIILIIDRSGSMGQNNKLVEAKNAAKNFINVVSQQESTTRIGMVSFSNTGTLSSPLTTDITSLNSKIDGLTANGNTCHECGIKTANTEIATHGRAGVKKVILLLTDGEANFIDGGTGQVSAAIAEQKALDAVKAGFGQSNTVFFSIGFDIKTADAPVFLTNIASLTGGKYYFPAPTELDAVYQEISQLIGKGLLGGFVFNDQNLNGAYDANEPKLPGWTVNATYAGGTKSATSDSNGNYTIAGLCDGSYTLETTKQTGWTQTLPANAAPYAITITNAGQFTDKVFGNTDKARCNDGIDNDNNGFKDIEDSTCHSDGNPKNPDSYVPLKDGEHGGNTCADSKDNNDNGMIDGADPVCHTDGDPTKPWDPNLPEVTPKTSVLLNVFLDGIGNRGDNTNPDSNSLSNKNPKHPTIGADIQIYTLDNQLIAAGTGSITYSSASGTYKGDVPIQTGFPSGKYQVKIKADTYLRRLANGIQTITAGQQNTVTNVPLVAGDINNDNQLNILDYNLILDCYSDLTAAANCSTPTKQVNADINDDALVNQIDYNLFLREISTQPGQ